MVWFARQLLAAILSFLLAVPVFSNGKDQLGTDTYDYDAFGNLIHSTGTSYNNYLFAGEQFDPDLNLYYNRARYLNTSTGRFWNMDRDEGDDEEPLSLGKYLYAEGDAVNNVDPTGNQIDDVLGAFGIGQTINAMPTLTFNPSTYTWRLASTISNRGEEFVKLEESLVRHPYNDLGTDKATGKGRGNCTIGYGHLLHYKPCTTDDYEAYPTPLSDGAAEQFLSQDLIVNSIIPIKHFVQVPLAQKEYDVLADFSFNAGPGSFQKSQILMILNLGLYSAVPNAIVTQNIKPGSKAEAGLRARRKDEAYLWVTGIYRVKGRIIP